LVQTVGFKFFHAVCDAGCKHFFTKLPSVKGLSDLPIKWNVSEVTSVASSEEAEHFKNILLDFGV
jgi:hypothetical protein